MNASGLAKAYDRLTAAKRFALILAAGARGDEPEQALLAGGAGELTLTCADYAPWAQAFDELALLEFIEVAEEAARFHDLWLRAADIDDWECDDEVLSPGRTADQVANPARPAQRHWDLVAAAGYVLRARAEGWQRFCQQRAVPPFALWEGLPGYNRLQAALAPADEKAFGVEEMVRFLNRVRPAGAPEATAAAVMTPASLAAGLEAMFRRRVGWWSGEPAADDADPAGDHP
jgi:hypothetical protein